MIYADTDFFLALLKEDDWLKANAKKMYFQHKGNITTSVATIIELLFAARKFCIDAKRLIEGVFALATTIEGIDRYTALEAAHYFEKSGLAPVDALHAAYCRENTIISSDHIFEKVGLRCLDLKAR